MGADMLVATIVVPADRVDPPDFEAGREALEQPLDPKDFHFDEPANDIEGILEDFDPSTHLDDDEPTAEAVRLAGLAIVEALEEAFGSREVTDMTIGAITLFVSGGLSWGDPPTEAAEAIWNAHMLPDAVLSAMGFVRPSTIEAA